jgi:thiosulfate reductase/polysulfide reductase chain A
LSRGKRATLGHPADAELRHVKQVALSARASIRDAGGDRQPGVHWRRSFRFNCQSPDAPNPTRPGPLPALRDRRGFLKASTLAPLAAPLAAAGAAGAQEASAVELAMEKKVPLLCRMCAQFCPLQGTVRHDRLVRVEANPNTPYAGACGRARAAVSALYSPNRIKTPLLRTGERGEGKFRRASWDEALEVVAKKLKELRDAGEARSVAFLPRFNSAAGMDKEFFDLYGTPNTVGYGDTCFNALLVGLGAICGGRLDRGVPVQGTTAASSDFERAAYGLLVGRNPGGALVTYTWGVSFGRGKKNGMQVTVVDPRKPSEAGESDAEWLPIRPGTDAAFLLAVMQVVLERK